MNFKIMNFKENKIFPVALLALVALFILFISSGSKSEHTGEDLADNDSTEIEPEVPFVLDYPEIKYTLVKLESQADIRNVINKYKDNQGGAAYRKALRTLNRKELRFFAVGQSVIVPDSVIDDMRAYSIFPDEYVAAKKIEKLIIVDNQYQSYACYEHGKLVRFAATNTGKETTPTFPGRYSLVWKQRVRLSSLDSTWVMPYCFNFHRFAGNAMHEFEMPGRPVSHSCLRQFSDDAEWIFKWGQQAKYDDSNQAIPHTGTPLIILNMFDYSRKTGGPWLDLASNKAHYVHLPDNPLEVEEALIPWCQIPLSSRWTIPNRERYINAEDTLRARGIIRPHIVLVETVDYNKLRREKQKLLALQKAKEQKSLDSIATANETKDKETKSEVRENSITEDEANSQSIDSYFAFYDATSEKSSEKQEAFLEMFLKEQKIFSEAMEKDFEEIEKVFEEQEKVFEAMEKDFEEMEKDFEAMEKDFEEIEKDFEEIEKDFEAMEKDFEEIEKVFEAMEKDFEEIEKDFEEIEKDFEEIEKDFEEIEKDFEEMEKDFEEMEKDFEELEKVFEEQEMLLEEQEKN